MPYNKIDTVKLKSSNDELFDFFFSPNIIKWRDDIPGLATFYHNVFFYCHLPV
jgi:hypothetical protein